MKDDSVLTGLIILAFLAMVVIFIMLGHSGNDAATVTNSTLTFGNK